MNTHIIITTMILATLCSCGSSKKSTSTIVNNRHTSALTTIISTPDTLTVELPVSVETVITHDSTSTLANDYAESTVTINHDGSIRHSLISRDKTLHIPVLKSTVKCDSVTFSNTGTHTKTNRSYGHTIVFLIPTIMIIAVMTILLLVKH